MATTEVSRVFDLQHQCVSVTLMDDLGTQSVHTIYLTPGAPGASTGAVYRADGTVDVNATVANLKAQVDTNVAAAMAAMRAAGWQG